MQKLEKKDGVIKWTKPEPDGFSVREFIPLEVEVVDNNTIHLKVKGAISEVETIYCFLINDTELDSQVFNDAESFINHLNN